MSVVEGLTYLPPFKEDFFERVIDVQWEAGLAVIFGDRTEDAPKPGTPQNPGGAAG
jgi:hypothetical protein